MRHLLLSLCLSAWMATTLNAQIGCPGCQINLPALPDDTLYLQNLPDGEKGQLYDHDISFRFPKTTTPVNAVDSTTPPGLPISKFEILSLDGLPPGLNWQPNQLVFETANQTDGCIRICGTPTVADSFTLTVKIKATVFIITQEATFPLKLYIAPPTVSNDGFSMSNFSGCGSTTVSFTNNHPSGGSPDYSYTWDFGDGTTFSGENPTPHTYSAPGVYPVNYHAVVDTGRFVLASATVLEADCADLLGLGAPDMYVLVFGPNGQELFNSSPDIENISLPFTFPITLPLDAGNYTIEVWDEDSGIEGSDDLCGAISFNYLSNDTLIAGGLEIALVIDKPVTEVFSADSVYVFEVPEAPEASAPNGTYNCTGATNLLLESSATESNQWLLDGEVIPGATEPSYTPLETGYYQVQITNEYGCTATSDSVLIGLYAAPAAPVFGNQINRLFLLDTLNVPAGYTFQWFESGLPIPGETGWSICIGQNGVYGLVVTDTLTGCSNFYAETVNYDPNYPDCISSSREPAAMPLFLFPNPAHTQVTLQWQESQSGASTLQIFDAAGRVVRLETVPAGASAHVVPTTELPSGVYSLQLTADRVYLGRLVVLH